MHEVLCGKGTADPLQSRGDPSIPVTDRIPGAGFVLDYTTIAISHSTGQLSFGVGSCLK